MYRADWARLKKQGARVTEFEGEGDPTGEAFAEPWENEARNPEGEWTAGGAGGKKSDDKAKLQKKKNDDFYKDLKARAKANVQARQAAALQQKQDTEEAAKEATKEAFKPSGEDYGPDPYINFGDLVQTEAGRTGLMRGSGGLGSDRVQVVDQGGHATWESKSKLKLLKRNKPAVVPTRIKIGRTEADPDERPLNWQGSFIPGDFHSTRDTQGKLFDLGPPGGKEPKKEKPRGDQPTFFADSGRWITIGGKKGADGERHGGSPVYIENGRITKGHPSLTGRKIGSLKDEPEPESHRTELNRSKGHAKAIWGKKAKTEGLDAGHLHQLAGDVMAHDKAYKGEATKVLQRARQLSKNLGYGDLTGLQARGARGRLDADKIKGLDDVAERVAEEYPETFYGHVDTQQRLFDLLMEGNPQAMTTDEAYEQAFEHLMEGKPMEEEVPFLELDSGGSQGRDFAEPL